ncbi:MAG: alanine:cation symporter family protein [Treponema sp.]|nr:alanine:cation symporter family protein [Treponema sp.]
MELFDSILTKMDKIVWGLPTIALILATGFILTLRTRGMQFKYLGRAIKSMFKKTDSKNGEVSSFGALCTALSATIGTGNIVGVATAIAAGGPGALFWMWLAALLGIATKYSECMLSVHFRERKEDGHILGGPFYTIEKGLGKNWKWLAVLFASFGVLTGLLGIGTITQINGITTAVNDAFNPGNGSIAFSIGDKAYSWYVVVAGILVTLAAALVIIGGLKRISKVAAFIVPAMALVYVFLGLSVLLMNATRIPEAFHVIFKSAFGLRAMAGGAAGFALSQMVAAMQNGVARGIFSNEAGLGSAPIAAASAQVEEPVSQGLVSMLGTFIDTLIICTMTGLAIVIAFYIGDGSGVGELKGVAITSRAFSRGLGGDGHSVQFLLMICLIFFAFTTILGWDYYSERCLEYLTNGKMGIVKFYRLLYIAAVFIGPYLTVNQVWTIADITNGLMAIPNCVSLIALSGLTAKMTREYFNKYPRLEDEP